MGKTIFFSVGEPSGDQHAARLIRSLRSMNPDLELRGFGGPAMRRAGCRIDLDLTEHAVVGILEVLPKLREFFGFADDAEAMFASGAVDAVVLVDFPGFNWHIAKRAKRYGIPVIYYCPPQLWAWGAWRVRKMKAWVDHVLAVLPIEQTFFSGHGIPTRFVGHPFFDAVDEAGLDQGVMRRLEAASPGDHTVAVLPGSRTHEVHRNWPIYFNAIRELAETHRGVRFAVAAYRDKHLAFCQDYARDQGGDVPLDFYTGATSEIIEHACCAMMVSGSVSLELMARQTPAVVTYRVGRFLYAFGKCVVKVDSMTLPNLMPGPKGTEAAEDRVFPEMVSVGNPALASRFVVDHVGRMLDDRDYLSDKRACLAALSDRYALPGASERAASELCEILDAERVGTVRRKAA